MKFCTRMLKKYGHWMFLGLMILITIYMDVYVARHILDSDTSEDVYHGWIIAQQNNPFTRDVYFSTELRLLDIASVFGLFFKFAEDWTLVRILGSVAMQAWYVLSFAYLCRQAGVSLRNTVFAAGLLLSPFSTPYARVVLYHLYYILYTANAFWLLGLTLRVFRVWQSEKRLAAVPAALLAALWAFVGMNGIRHMMILGIPLLMYVGVRCLQVLNEHHWEPGLGLRRQSFWKTDAMRMLGVVAVSFVCFAVGFVISQVWLLPHFGVMDMSDTIYRPNAPASRYLEIFHGWLIASGVRNSSLPLVGIRGLSLAAALFGFACPLYLSYRALKEKQLAPDNLLMSMLFSSFMTTTLIFLFDSTARIFEQYYVLVCVWAIPALAVEMQRCQKPSASTAKRLLALAACACLVVQGAYTTLYVRADKDGMDKWECLYFDRFTAMDEVRDCIDFMQENNYTHAMTDYWYANVMMEMTDGELTVAPMLVNYQETPALSLQEWGTSRSAFAKENLPPKMLVFFERAKAAEFEKNYPQVPLVHEGWIFNGYEIDASMIK